MSEFFKVEVLLARALDAAASILSDSEVAEVQHFTNVGEYGLALETLVAIFRDTKKSMSKETLRLLEQAAMAMELDPAILLNRVHIDES